MSENRLRTKTLLSMNFFGALGALLVSKLAIYTYIVSGAEGRTPVLKTFAKLFLCLGWDMVGAVLIALLATLISLPFLKRPKVAFSISGFIQAVHIFFDWVSYIVQKNLGAPLGKPAIDLGFLNSDPSIHSHFTLGSSSALNVNLPNMTVMALMILATAGLMWLANRVKWGRWSRGLAWFFGVGFAVTTILILPNLRNGQVWGIRVHTFGLERSPVTYLLDSYLRPLTHGTTSTYKGDPFCFNMQSIANPEKRSPKPPLAGAVPQKTNLVVIILESVGYLDYSSNPSPMPFLHSLASKGIALPQHYSTWPQTMKALFSFYCSELPYSDYQTITSTNPAIPCISIVRALKQAGYNTALFESADFSYDRQLRFFKHRAFDEMYDMYTLPGAKNAWKDSWGVAETLTVKDLLQWTATRKGHRFAVFYNMVTGHHPYAFEGYKSKIDTLEHEKESYHHCLKYIDQRIRQVVDGLRQEGLLDNTLVVVFSDHGEGFGRHPRTFSHGPVVYEEAIRVPMVMYGPQFKNIAGFQVGIPTSHIDLAPTILGLLGVKVPFTMKGRNLLKNNENRLLIFGSRPPEAQLGIRDGRWKFILTQDTGVKELFDLKQDPMERTNLVEKYPDLTGKFTRRVLEWKAFSRNLIENYQSILAKYGRRCDK